MDEEGDLNLEGTTLKFAQEAYDPGEVQEILMSLLGTPSGTLTIEDAPDAT